MVYPLTYGATVVVDNTGIVVPHPTRYRDGQLRADVPRYDPATLGKIHRFLASCLGHAQMMVETEKELAKGSANDPRLVNRVLYWQHVVSAINWLAYRATCKQEHLILMTNEECEEIIASCIQHAKQ